MQESPDPDPSVDAESARFDSTVPPTLDPQRRKVAPVVPDQRDPRGTVFGKYVLLEEISRGGMGVVYKARQRSLNRIVALKMILTGRFATEDDLRRFYIEATAAAGLTHPNIVRVYEVDECDGHHFFSMDYIEGQSLHKRLTRGPLTPKEAATIMLTVAETIQHAHDQAIIHRDLKPANILVDGDGVPHITDFGLAKKLDEDHNTAHGEVMGTIGFIPPEQATGELEDIGPAADVYSIGATLYCLLTGRPPFISATPTDTLFQLLNRDPVSPRQLDDRVPQDLETIVLKCLEKQPHRRYTTAQELADELRRFQDGEPILARPVGRLTQLGKWAQRNRIQAMLVCVLVLSVIALFATSLMYHSLLRDERSAARDAEQRARQLQDVTRSLIDTIVAQNRGEDFDRASRFGQFGTLARRAVDAGGSPDERMAVLEDMQADLAELKLESEPTLQRLMLRLREPDGGTLNAVEFQRVLAAFRRELRSIWLQAANRMPETQTMVRSMVHGRIRQAVQDVERIGHIGSSRQMDELRILHAGQAQITAVTDVRLALDELMEAVEQQQRLSPSLTGELRVLLATVSAACETEEMERRR